VPVDEIVAAPPARLETVPPAAPVILFAGRLATQKNLAIMLQGIRLALEGTEAHAVLCGEGPEQAELARTIEESGEGGRIHLAGFRDDLWGLMKTAGVLVSVSRFEGHPNTVLEAMTCGCPVVVSDIPEHREFLDERSAWLVDPESPEQVGAALRSAITDRAEAARRIAEARQIADGFSLPLAVERYDAVYRAVLPHSRASAS
jgi:glycosyltransferase involved in cell wall biosynthesis